MIAVFLIVALLHAPQQQAECWVEIGTKDLYSSYQQIADLQRVAKSGVCETVATTWQVRLRPDRHSMMLWDSASELVALINVEGSSATWEVWRGVDRSHILTDDPAREFDYATHSTGEGKIPVSEDVRDFIRLSSGEKFAPAL